MEGERGRSLRAMTYSSFFDGPVGHNLCPKKCLTTSKKVGGGGGGGGGGWVLCASLNCEINRVIIRRPSS